jgi:hypothetical protein
VVALEGKVLLCIVREDFVQSDKHARACPMAKSPHLQCKTSSREQTEMIRVLGITLRQVAHFGSVHSCNAPTQGEQASLKRAEQTSRDKQSQEAHCGSE